jgi:hypothetical protein
VNNVFVAQIINYKNRQKLILPSHNSCDKIRKQIMEEKKNEMMNIILKFNGLHLSVGRHISWIV